MTPEEEALAQAKLATGAQAAYMDILNLVGGRPVVEVLPALTLVAATVAHQVEGKIGDAAPREFTEDLFKSAMDHKFNQPKGKPNEPV